MINKQIKISVIGAGAWGSAIAHVLASKKRTVHLWAREEEVVKSVNEEHINKLYLPGLQLNRHIKACSSLEEVLHKADLVVNVVPTQFIRSVWKSAKLDDKTVLVNASKGIEQNSLFLISQIFEEILPGFNIDNRFCVLSGPSFAEEVIKGLPTNVSLASSSPELAKQVSEIFHLPHFRTYTLTDIIGVQLGGALKNVIAIAAGAVDGMNLGLNTRAALITRGLSEIARLGTFLGAKPETFSGLSGMGDLILTCTGSLSRNHSVGYRLGQGEKLSSIIQSVNSVAEGVTTAKSAFRLAQKHGVDMPITEAVYSGLYLDTTPEDALKSLLSRKLKHDGI